MGKSVVVKPGFSSVRGPSPKGYKTYQAGQTIVYTDAEYSALTQADLRTLGSPTTVTDPDRPAIDVNSRVVNRNATATGTVTAALGPNAFTLTGNITLVFPTGVTSGNMSSVELYLTQDATGSRTLTLPASAKAAGGTAPVLSTGVNKIDYLKYQTLDGGNTWYLVDKQIDLR